MVAVALSRKRGLFLGGEAEDAACAFAGVAGVGDGELAVYEEVANAGAVQVRVVVGGEVAEGAGVEDDDVGEVTGLEVAAFGQAEYVGGEAGGAADGLLEGDDL